MSMKIPMPIYLFHNTITSNTLHDDFKRFIIATLKLQKNTEFLKL